MRLESATRKKVKLRLNIASPSGFGKTYGALLIAYGITGNWETVGVIDTENDSASLYSNLGSFKTLRLDPPFTAERYIEAIKICEKEKMEVIIIDSITHFWNGQGGILEYQNSLGGRYQDWAKATPLYQKWLNTILQSSCHIITTNRKKQGYNIITDGNKTKVEKAGLEDEIRSGYEYEMSLALEIINENHLTKASKDRTGLFANKPEFIITENTGKQILDWCNEGVPVDENKIFERISDCKSLDELLKLYYQNPVQDDVTLMAFTQKRTELEQTSIPTSLTKPKFSSNGAHK
ncbi:MAG: AAA family ATPase [Bacteroidota bacterium]|nr:AAA family ATPase [Bacteroidota bacterium]